MKRRKTKLLFNFGINDVDYPVTKTEVVDGKRKVVWICPFYRKWKEMLKRCYSEKFLNTRPTYRGCTVDENWRSFSVFKSWMETQDWEGKVLDKDLLVKGNKIYSPDTCMFIDGSINSFLVENDATRGKWAVGVIFRENRGVFQSQACSVIDGKTKHLGHFNTEEEAHQAWVRFKLKQAYILAESQTEPRIIEALIKRYETQIIK